MRSAAVSCPMCFPSVRDWRNLQSFVFPSANGLQGTTARSRGAAGNTTCFRSQTILMRRGRPRFPSE